MIKRSNSKTINTRANVVNAIQNNKLIWKPLRIKIKMKQRNTSEKIKTEFRRKICFNVAPEIR